ncbi:fibroblast growth factor (acidic) intracellular binding protein a isoform X1 [Gambusia affinis]|nr:fibroblast growth factor (acidic) intracellular binding protein a isoform X1 [Gambusia affinis]
MLTDKLILTSYYFAFFNFASEKTGSWKFFSSFNFGAAVNSGKMLRFFLKRLELIVTRDMNAAVSHRSDQPMPGTLSPRDCKSVESKAPPAAVSRQVSTPGGAGLDYPRCPCWSFRPPSPEPPCRMAVELDVFVGNTTIMDEEVYQLWLDGYTVNDAVKVRMAGGVLDECEANQDVLLSDTMDQYRTFQMCERLLQSPAKLANQLLFQIPPHRQTMLIERYYAFDDVFVREVLGKKLSKGTKKDLDDISAKTGVTLKSCRRQFDNFKRVFKVVEELKGPLVENIRQHFLLSDKLARDYAAIVFFANNRFETGKKKLQYLTFQDFAFCAGQLINNWTVGAVDNMVEDMDVDLDKEFLQELKELKILITDKDLLDQHKSLVCTALRGKTKAFAEMEANFKNLSRGLVNIATKLTNTKDVRDFFIDLVEKFIEPCRSDRWTPADIKLYLTHYTNSAHILDSFKHQAVWDRYMGVIKSCIYKMYHD